MIPKHKIYVCMTKGNIIAIHNNWKHAFSWLKGLLFNRKNNTYIKGIYIK